jgi:hypothetical protein
VSQEANAFVGSGVPWLTVSVDQTFAQVKGNEALLRYAELLNRGFDFGHRAHGSISAAGPSAGNVGGPGPKIYEMGN